MEEITDEGNELNWSPEAKVVFSDTELVRELRRTRDLPAERAGNWWTFFSALPKPEQERLEAAVKR